MRSIIGLLIVSILGGFLVSQVSSADFSCLLYTNCSTCLTNPTCGWCGGPDLCLGKGNVADLFGLPVTGQFLCTADKSLNGSWLTSSCSLNSPPCSNYLSCDECKADSRCGYCQATPQYGKCFTKYYDKFCLSAAWSWNPSVCPAFDSCMNQKGCVNCMNSPGCGWCHAGDPELPSCFNTTSGFDTCTAVMYTNMQNHLGVMFLSSNATAAQCPMYTTGTTGFVATEPVNSIQSSEATDNGGAIAAGILVPLFLIAICVALVIAFLLYRKKKKQQEQSLEAAAEGTVKPNTEPAVERYEKYPGSESNSLQQQDSLMDQQRKFVTPKQDDQWNISSDHLIIEQEIGRGASGIVYKGTWRATPVAIKLVATDNMTAEDKSAFKAEIDLMKKLRHHVNVILLLGVCQEPLAVITQFMPKGSLFGFIRSSAEITNEQQLKIIRGIARGMLHLHMEYIIHRDLAARNVLLTDDLEPKISDFGMSRATRSEDASKTESNVGPLKWMAPEYISKGEFSFKSDVWSFACTLVEILSRDKPYPNLLPLQAATMVSAGELTPQPPPTSDPFLINLISQCTAFQPNDRPDFKHILNSIETEKFLNLNE